MDANSGKPWSKMDIADLTYSLAPWQQLFGRGEHVVPGHS